MRPTKGKFMYAMTAVPSEWVTDTEFGQCV
jgi:hypothetical protein